MHTLLREHWLLICAQLDGDDYLSLAQTCSTLGEQLNEKSFLRDLLRLIGYPFLVADAAFYSYCYSQYFLGRRNIRNEYTFTEVLRRTFQAGKITTQGLMSLKRWLCEKMKLLLLTTGRLDSELLKELKQTHRLCRKYQPKLA